MYNQIKHLFFITKLEKYITSSTAAKNKNTTVINKNLGSLDDMDNINDVTISITQLNSDIKST